MHLHERDYITQLFSDEMLKHKYIIYEIILRCIFLNVLKWMPIDDYFIYRKQSHKNMTPVYSNDLVLSAILVLEQQVIVIVAFNLYQNLELRILIRL